MHWPAGVLHYGVLTHIQADLKEQILRNRLVFSLTVYWLCSAMANALQVGEERLAGDALSISLILAAAAGTIFLIALQVIFPDISVTSHEFTAINAHAGGGKQCL